MHRHLLARAIQPLLAAVLALTASLALVADASTAPAAAVAPLATSALQAEVEDLTTGNLADAPTDAGSATLLGLAAQGLGWAGPLSSSVPDAAPTSTAASSATPSAAKTPPVWWSRYSGTNHVWMPTLGMSKAVYLFSCSRSTDPANYVYRWGCAGRNNVYLLGHNFGVFHPLYQAYYNGKLKKGMPVIYADSSGRTRLYRVVSWRVVSPNDSAWAIAAQPRPSMKLQTCIGPNGSLRLNVRLVAVDR